MRTNLEFCSDAFPPLEGESEQTNPGRYGKRLADFLTSQLPAQGFTPLAVDAEDWGWRIDLANDAFPLWIGCGNYEEYPDGFLCFIEPSTPTVRRWLKQIPTNEIVDRLAAALEHCLQNNADVRNLRWWDTSENARG